MKYLLLCSAACMAFGTAPLSAASFVEGVDYVDAPSVALGTIGIGDHIISGGLSGDCLGTDAPYSCLFGVDPQDTVTFDTAAGTAITHFSFILSSDLADSAALSFDFTYGDDDASFAFSGLLEGTYDTGLTRSAGGITMIFSGFDAAERGPYSGDWAAHFTVAAVPLPGAFSFLGLGLACLGFRGINRRESMA